MSLRTEVVSAARKSGGSFKTVEARSQIGKQLCDYLKEQNIQIKSLADLKEKHLQGFIARGKAAGITDRTNQNRLSAIRSVLRSAGLSRKAAGLTTKKFGIEKASRDGSRAAISRTDFEQRLAQVKDPGVHAVLVMQRELGLRQLEAIMGGRPDTLERWEKELTTGACRICIGEGTKGGRPRETLPVDKEKALAAIRTAKAVAASQPGGRLIEAKGLKEAVDRFNNQARAAGFTGDFSPHTVRYSFAQDSVARYEAAGFSHREALAFTSLDLGHGDGRGRWVEQVYCRR